MAHFAQIKNGKVIQVIVVNNEVILDENGVEQESIGQEFCRDLLGGDWIQTSYNGNFRNKYAGIGDFYNAELDVFLTPKCHDEAELTSTFNWDCANEAHNVIS